MGNGRLELEARMRTEFDVKYELGHSYTEEWECGELHCPGCGRKGVWEENSCGDYYCGPNYCCPACGAVFTIQWFGVREENWQDQQRTENIRAELKKRGHSASLPITAAGQNEDTSPGAA